MQSLGDFYNASIVQYPVSPRPGVSQTVSQGSHHFLNYSVDNAETN